MQRKKTKRKWRKSLWRQRGFLAPHPLLQKETEKVTGIFFVVFVKVQVSPQLALKPSCLGPVLAIWKKSTDLQIPNYCDKAGVSFWRHFTRWRFSKAAWGVLEEKIKYEMLFQNAKTKSSWKCQSSLTFIYLFSFSNWKKKTTLKWMQSLQSFWAQLSRC